MKKKNVAVILTVATVLGTMMGSMPVQAAKSEDEEITMTMIDHTSEDIKIEWEDSVVEGFMEEHPNVTIEVQRMSMDDYTQTIATKFASDDAPDIFVEDSSTLPIYIKNGYVADITDTDAVGKMTEGACEALSQDGKVYALPVSSNSYVVTYNKTVFEDAGITEVPKTAEEFYADCDKLKEAGYTPIELGYKDTWVLMGDFQTDYINNVLTKDPEAVTKLQDRSEKWVDSEEWKAVVERLKERYSNANADPFGTDWASACTALATGECGMILNGDWTSNNAAAYGDVSDFGAFALPVTDNADDAKIAKLAGGQGYCLNANSENLDMAKEFLNYMTSDECVESYIENCNEVCLVDGASAENATGSLADVMDLRENNSVVYTGIVNFDNEFSDAVLDCLSDYLLSDSDADDALKALDTEFDRIAGK